MRTLIARLSALVGALTILGLTAAGASAVTPGHYTGTLPDGAVWVADVPAAWNGTLLLYSHGFGPLVAADAPDPTTAAALLSEGYALAGSSYDPNGPWWALGSALTDQFGTLATVEQTVLKAKPAEVFAFGTSMGGLVSALEDQGSNGRIDGALTTCGIVAGENVMNQYQLDGEYAISALLAPGEPIQLTNFVDGPSQGFADGFKTAAQLTAAAQAAQGTAQGKARLALAMAFLNVSPWGDQTPPSIYDYAAQEQGQYDDYFVSNGGLSAIQFIEIARGQLEAAAGGESAGTVGVDFARLLYHSSYYPEVKALYDEAGLNLQADLATLAAGANLRPDPGAYFWNQRTSVPSGQLQVPELDLKTISDQLVPVQQESYYHQLVARSGDDALLRQAFVAAQGHCNFTPAELVAGVQALAARVKTGAWGSLASAGALNAAAAALPSNLGGGAFVPFWPNKVTGVVSPFDELPVPFGGPLPFTLPGR
jgi:hypothetical protein